MKSPTGFVRSDLSQIKNKQTHCRSLGVNRLPVSQRSRVCLMSDDRQYASEQPLTSRNYVKDCVQYVVFDVEAQT